MNDILGYTSDKSSYELYKHGKFLEENVPQKYKKEMDCIYDWVKTREFCSAMDNNTKESWMWLKSSMVHPPLQIINKYEKEAEKRKIRSKMGPDNLARQNARSPSRSAIAYLPMHHTVCAWAGG